MVVSRRARELHRRVAGVEQREAAGAVGRLHHAGLEAALPDRWRPAGRRRCRECARRRRANAATSCRNRRRSRAPPATARPECRTARAVPSSHWPRADIEQQRARRIGGVGRVHLAAGEVPEQERVDRAERELAGFRRRARAAHVVEQPGDFRRREIRIEQQAGAAR